LRPQLRFKAEVAGAGGKTSATIAISESGTALDLLLPIADLVLQAQQSDQASSSASTSGQGQGQGQGQRFEVLFGHPAQRLSERLNAAVTAEAVTAEAEAEAEVLDAGADARQLRVPLTSPLLPLSGDKLTVQIMT
jgi:hypothetical protein